MIAHSKTWTCKATGTDVLKGAAAGLVGGIAGAWMMNRVHAAISAFTPSPESETQQAGQEEPGDAQAANRGGEQGSDPTTVIAAEAVSRRVLHHELTPREKQAAGPLMHYGFGAAAGAIYGATAEVLPEIKLCKGTGYGTLVWLAADEAAVPAFGLAEPPTQQPLRAHISAWAAHLAFGLTCEAVRRTLVRL